MSTVVTAGKAEAVVFATGMQTELGKIAGLLQHESAGPTPLQRRLGELGRILVVVCLIIVGVIFALELARGGRVMDVLIRSISLAVAAVPEGLPAVVTLALALGLQRMVARNVLIRRLPSVETLGSVTVVCSDKTGTLTRNEMTVRVFVAGNQTYRVTGAGYVPSGAFQQVSPEGESTTADIAPESVPDLFRALTIGIQCNNARITKGEGADNWRAIGDPTEAALVVAAMKAGIEPRPPSEHVLSELPFDSERKAMSVILPREGGAIMYTKGAPEGLLPLCQYEQRDGEIVPLSDERRREIAESNSQLASQALRVLALAFREYSHTHRDEFAEEELVFSGLAGMIDPPREEVKAAVERCRNAGVKPVMITGDHPETAAAIARELLIAEEGGRALTGRELDAISDERLAEEVTQISVYARVSPEHKLRVIRAWKSRGAVVGMTGDGVNDAPAVKAADIGIAMGITGTDVTKEASDMVLTDDNFTSIVGAVEEGRGIFDNIQKFIHYLLSCNAGEVLLMFFAAVIGWPAPLEAIQILWINLVTDGLPALALAMEPPEQGIMDRPPRPPREPVITRARGILIALHGLLIATAAGIGFAYILHRAEGGSLERARTVAFCIMSYAQLFFAIGCRSHFRTLPQLGLFSNPHLLGAILISGLLQTAVILLPFARSIFDTTALETMDWGIILGLSLLPITIIELVKLLRMLTANPSQPQNSAQTAPLGTATGT
jgi:Ca2+-transporting ATPase